MTSIKSNQGKLKKEELNAVHQTIKALVSVFKSYSIYSEDHVFSEAYLDKFRSQLETFLEKYKEFPLTIEKNTFYYKGEKVFDKESEENNPAYLLTRDGLTKLAFLQGVESDELATLVRIFNQNRSAAEETGGDIVTSLWQSELKHIEYEEADIFAREEYDFDLGTLKVLPGDDDTDVLLQIIGETDEEGRSESIADQPRCVETSETVSNLLSMETPLTFLELTPGEKATLESYIEEEEKRDYTNDIIDILLIILASQKNKLHFDQVLEFLESVFFDALNRINFKAADKLCSNVLAIGKHIKTLRPWSQELIDSFLIMLSIAERWVGLSWMKNTHLLMLNQENLKYLWHIFRMLPPESMFAMGQCLGNVDNISIRNELYELIENKAKNDPEKFGFLLSQSDEKMGLLLFSILESLEKKDAANITFQIISHESAQVRRMGLDGYLTFESSPDVEALYPLLSDEDDIVVSNLLAFLLSSVEHSLLEGEILKHLRQAIVDGVERAHVFEYYKALSRCGSHESVKFLEDILLGSKFTEMFSNVNALHKKGSALALKIIGTEEALNVLHEGKESLSPDIRLACQFALENM